MTRRLHAAVLLAVLSLSGCAGARLAPAIAEPLPDPEERAAQVRQECHQSAASAVESRVLGTALGSAGLASIYLVVRGAADGAFWGSVHGGGSGARDGAWIGAAAGAGLGMIIGVGVGIKEGVEAYGRYRSAFDACVAGRLAPSSDGESATVEGQLAAPLVGESPPVSVQNATR